VSLLDVRSAVKRYGHLRALTDVSLEIPAASGIHGLIGPNGSGKTTLLKAIAGEHRLTGGRIFLNGADVTRMPMYQRIRRGMGVKFQITSIVSDLSVLDNVLLAAQSKTSTRRLLSSDFESLIDASRRVLDDFWLLDVSHSLAGTLSHGQQQWLEIAMAVARNPTLLLLDEPTAGMGPEERRHTGELLRRLSSEMAIVIVEHDLDFVRSICEEITVLESGRVLDRGTPHQVRTSTKVKAAFTGEMEGGPP